MKFLWDWDEAFFHSLEAAGLLSSGDGLKFRQSPWATREEKFNHQIRCNTALREQIFTLKRPLAIDRGVGGAPYDPYSWDREVLQEIAETLGGDFLGIQIHEWCGAVNRDFHTLTRYGVSAIGEGPSARPPRLGFGMHKDYAGPQPALPASPALVQEMLNAFDRKRADFHDYAYLVEGHDCSYHLGFSHGARAAFSEVGRQIPVAGIHLAALRGAARYHQKPWGCYYEPWDEPWRERRGTHFSRKSLWKTPEADIPYDPLLGHGGHFGSSRALQRRLLYAALMSGADFYAEEYGYENTFQDPAQPILTPYGEVLRELTGQNREGQWGEPWHPIVMVVDDALWPLLSQGAIGDELLLSRSRALPRNHPLRLLLQACFLPAHSTPEGECGVLPDGRFPQLFEIIPASCATGRISYDLALYVGDQTPTAPDALHALYPRVLSVGRENIDEAVSAIEDLYHGSCPLRIEGNVFTMINREGGNWIIGLFNPYGISRGRELGDIHDPSKAQPVTIAGSWSSYRERTTPAVVRVRSSALLEATVPPGGVCILSFSTL